MRWLTRWRSSFRFDLLDNERLIRNLLNALPFWTGAFIAGGIAVFYARLFAWAESGSQLLYARDPRLFFLFTPLCFIAAFWLVKRYAPFARGSGIPQVSASIELSNPKEYGLIPALLSARVLIVKIVSSLVLVLGGGVIGREGPTIQISAAVFKKINDWLPEWYPKISKRNMIITGAAAGLASAFNTPLGGIVFAIEELTSTHFNYFKTALLTGVIIAGLTALNFLGPYLYLGYPALEGISGWIFAVILLVALLSGLAGSGMSQLVVSLLRWKQQFQKPFQGYLFALVCGLLVVGMAFFIDHRTFGSGKEIMVSVLFGQDKELDWYVPLLRIAGPVISFISGAAGGIFAPSLAAGASIGGVLSGWLHLGAADSNLIILCGMTAFLTSVTRSPFTSSILVYEMTNSHSVIIYIMLAALTANLVANLMHRRSLYEQLKDRILEEVRPAQNG